MNQKDVQGHYCEGLIHLKAWEEFKLLSFKMGINSFVHLNMDGRRKDLWLFLIKDLKENAFDNEPEILDYLKSKYYHERQEFLENNKEWMMSTTDDEILSVCWATCEEEAKKIFEMRDDRIELSDWDSSLWVQPFNATIVNQKESLQASLEYLMTSEGRVPDF